MAYIQKVVTALPPVRLDQEQVLAMGRRILKGRIPFVDQALKLIANAGVENRHLVRTPDEILDNDTLSWRNEVYTESSIQLGGELMTRMFESGVVAPEDVDLIITTSCTGFMIPSVDAYLISRFRLRPDVKRLPITELGCAAGAMALSRAHDYLRAFPHHRVLILAIELPSLTYRTRDFRVANLVSAALFGDGAAGVLLSSEPGPCRILDTRTHFFYDTPEMMGFDLSESGFKIILDKKIPGLVAEKFVEPARAFVNDQPEFVTEGIQHHLFHPGGRRILDTLRDEFGLKESQVAASRKVLAEVGNLSSASVMWVLDEVLKTRPHGNGLMAAFGPGFNAELLALRFHASANDVPRG